MRNNVVLLLLLFLETSKTSSGSSPEPNQLTYSQLWKLK